MAALEVDFAPFQTTDINELTKIVYPATISTSIIPTQICMFIKKWKCKT